MRANPEQASLFPPPTLRPQNTKHTHTHRPWNPRTRAAIHPRRLYFCTCTVPKRDNPNSAARRRRRKQPEPCAYSRQHSFWPARLPWPSLLVLVLSRARMPQHSSLPPRAELRRGRDETRTPSCGITPAGKTAPPLISSPALSLSPDIPSSHFTIEPIGLREPKTAAGRKGRAGGRAAVVAPPGRVRHPSHLTIITSLTYPRKGEGGGLGERGQPCCHPPTTQLGALLHTHTPAWIPCTARGCPAACMHEMHPSLSRRGPIPRPLGNFPPHMCKQGKVPAEPTAL